jgi:DNA helicase-2/ATP-dependent DNA helicase PcrA
MKGPDSDQVEMAGAPEYPPEANVKLNGPPGTGKTTQLLERTTRLLDSGYAPSDIAFITYRKEMASEFLYRLFNRGYITRSEAEEPWSEDTRLFGTIHGVCNRLTGDTTLAEASHKRDFVEQEYGRSYAGESDRFSAPGSDNRGWGKKMFEAYDWLLQNERQTFAAAPGLSAGTRGSSEIPPFEEFDSAWTDYMEDAGDSDERLQDFINMLREVRDEGKSPRADVLIVDEYHDMTPIMRSIAETWMEGAEVVIAAGDPLQSIYGFQGSDPRFFTELDLPEVVLDKTFRVPENIWEYARSVTYHDPPDIEPADSGGTVAETRSSPYDVVRRYGIDSTLFLARTQSEAMSLARSLRHNGIIFRSQSGMGGWNHSGTLLALYDTLQKLRGVYPADNINPNTGQTGFDVFGDEGSASSNLPGSIAFGSSNLVNLIEKVPAGYLTNTKKSTTATIDASNVVPGDVLMEYVTPEFWEDFTSAEDSVSNLLQYGPKETLKKALEHNTNPVENIDTAPVPDVMTIHASKGKEAETVFVRDGMPKPVYEPMVGRNEAAMEESRVWYVAATRASDTLLVSKDMPDYYEEFLPSATVY